MRGRRRCIEARATDDEVVCRVTLFFPATSAEYEQARAEVEAPRYADDEKRRIAVRHLIPQRPHFSTYA